MTLVFAVPQEVGRNQSEKDLYRYITILVILIFIPIFLWCFIIMDLTTLVKELKELIEEDCVLIDTEDRYVYSFEKIYLKKAYPMPDIVVRVLTPDNASKVMNFGEKNGIKVIQRGDLESISSGKTTTPIILLDNVKRPLPGDNLAESKEPLFTPETIQKLSNNTQSIINNISLIVEKRFSRKDISHCLQRKICAGYCTVTNSYNGIETWSSKGRMLLIRGLLRGEIDFTSKAIDVIYSCSNCGNCFSECFQDLTVNKAITQMRNFIDEKNLVPQAFHTASNNITSTGDPSAMPIERRLAWTSQISGGKLPENATNLYWVGCMVANRTPKVAKAFYNILTRSQVDFTMLGSNEGCCGYVLITAGMWNEGKQIAIETIKRIEESKAEVLVTPCSGCYYTFSKLYPEMLDVSLSCEILHSSQYLERMINEGQLTLGSNKSTITYHDPCSLGRHCKVYDAPRNVLNAIPDLKLVEMPLNRNLARCCGGGGGLWNMDYKVSMDSASRRLKEDSQPTNVDLLTTSCPQCQMNFNLTSRKKRIPIKTKDIVELVEAAMIVESITPH